MARSIPKNVAAVLDAYPSLARLRLVRIRDLILEVALQTDGVGALTETLKWGEPAYLTPETGAGTTIRLAWKPAKPDQVGLYVHCQTDLVDQYRALFGDELKFEGDRAIVLPVKEPPPKAALIVCIRLALTYHLARKQKRRRATRTRTI